MPSHLYYCCKLAHNYTPETVSDVQGWDKQREAALWWWLCKAEQCARCKHLTALNTSWHNPLFLDGVLTLWHLRHAVEVSPSSVTDTVCADGETAAAERFFTETNRKTFSYVQFDSVFALLMVISPVVAGVIKEWRSDVMDDAFCDVSDSQWSFVQPRFIVLGWTICQSIASPLILDLILIVSKDKLNEVAVENENTDFTMVEENPVTWKKWSGSSSSHVCIWIEITRVRFHPSNWFNCGVFGRF